MKTGVVKSLKPTYGFIRGDDGGDYFFLPTEVKGVEFSRLTERQRVSFEIQNHEKGLRAVDVMVN